MPSAPNDHPPLNGEPISCLRVTAPATDGVIRAAQWHRVVQEAADRDGARCLSLRAVLMKQPLSAGCLPPVPDVNRQPIFVNR